MLYAARHVSNSKTQNNSISLMYKRAISDRPNDIDKKRLSLSDLTQPSYVYVGAQCGK